MTIKLFLQASNNINFSESWRKYHDDNVRKRWPSTLQSLSEVLNSELKRTKVDEPHLADKLTIALGHYFGGRDIYIPNGSKLKSALRNISIWREYNGRNIEQLAATHTSEYF
ncbi:Mor transcription activator family protein [Photobacterium profundum]|uniref:Hypothetical bacteriophage transcriptional regulator n=1 Tax=Photobacterium profundum (strain SS9) TaxID=298386 RepID=Q6LKN9_PHOPR|nr:Mor transcription activator family protein [Photobacterium profundum]CAG21963.1 hypothetical bacteriophage transcriptional regulator [Photobacterium profundum SS9]